MKRDITKLVSVGSDIYVARSYLADTKCTYSKAVVTRANKSSVYFRYIENDFGEIRADKSGKVENDIFGRSKYVLVGEEELQEYLKKVIDNAERAFKAEYVISRFNKLPFTEVERLFLMLKEKE